MPDNTEKGNDVEKKQAFELGQQEMQPLHQRKYPSIPDTFGDFRLFAKGRFPKGWFWLMFPATEISSKKYFSTTAMNFLYSSTPKTGMRAAIVL